MPHIQLRGDTLCVQWRVAEVLLQRSSFVNSDGCGFSKVLERKEILAAGVDLNHRPLGYEFLRERGNN